MRRLSLLPLTLGALFGLACMCGGGDQTEEIGIGSNDYTYDAEWEIQLVDPWLSMSLPIGSGLVFVSDPAMLLVSYEGDQVSSLSSSYDAAVQAAGWSLTEDLGTPEFTARVYSKGSDAVGLGVGAEEGMTFVYLEFLQGMGSGTVDASKSKVAGSKGKPVFMQDGGPGKLSKSKGGKGIKGKGGKRKAQ